MENVVLSCIESRVENNRSLYGRFQLGPFDRGQGITVANAMRRTLLAELSGLAIVCVEIQGVSHEYSNIKGIRESVLDILLNLKQIVFVSDKKSNQPEIGFIKMQGPGTVKAGDLKLPPFLKCVDPDQYIATLSDNGRLELKCMVCKGKNFLVQTSFELIEKAFQVHFHRNKKTGYTEFFNFSNQVSKTGFSQIPIKFEKNKIKPKTKTAIYIDEENINKAKISKEFISHKIDFQKFEKNILNQKQKTNTLQSIRHVFSKSNLRKQTSTNILLIDAVFMPVTKVNFSIQNIDSFSKEKDSTLEKKFTKNYLHEKIILEVWTNGSIHPHNAIHQAAEELVTMFLPFQKLYSYKKINLFVQPTILNKPISHTSSLLHSSHNSSIYIKTGSSLEKSKNNTNLIPTLNRIYRPWKTKLKNSIN